MKKMNYIQPIVETLEYRSDAIMLPESPGGEYNPAPAHRTAPEVPGEGL